MARRNLEQLLKASAKTWAQRATILARSKAPKHIAPHITSKSKVDNGSVTITQSIAVVEKENYGTLDAAAQEYGYPGAVIKPKKQYLAFYWMKAGKPVIPNFPARYDADGRILLGRNYMTGEVQPLIRKPMKAFNNDQGYMRPAANEWAEEIKASSSKFKDAIRLDILDAFNKVTKVNLAK